MENWREIIVEIRSLSGMTQPQIAAEVDCVQSYISDLETGKKGKRVSHTIAKNILLLHEKVKLNKSEG